ncbi:MAG: tetratricopeptide repeat protein [Planctomycetes bacterium]|nr:tetratricopeptide repeat protein [Planctomycetota bacterium]
MKMRVWLVCLFAAALPARADRAAAERAAAEGDAALSRGDARGAIEAYGRAIDADPRWPVGWGRRALAKLDANMPADGLEEFGRAIALEPDSFEWRIGRAQALLQLDRPGGAIEDMDHLLKKFPDYPDALTIRGMALVLSGDVDAGLAQQDRALQLSGGDPRLLVRNEGLLRKADWPALLADLDRRDAAGIRDGSAAFYRTVALVESGEYDRAAEVVAALARGPRSNVLAACRVWLASTPDAGKHFDPAAAEREIPALAADLADSNGFVTHARALWLLDRPQDAFDILATRGRRTHFGTLLWLGASCWKLGRFEEAHGVLRDARRLNPHFAKHAARIPGFAEFAASVETELKAEAGADRGRLGAELATHLLTVAEIETLVRSYRFAQAADEYARLLQSVASAARKAEIEARLPEVRGMAGALAKLVASVNRAGGKTKVKVGRTELTLSKADDAAFDFTIPGGNGRFLWACLDTPVFCALALETAPSPEETLGLACLAWDAGERALAMKLFEEAAKKKPALRAGVNAFVARRRGLPPGEFVLWRGSYVTAAEKANYEKGLVPFEGAWVTPKDREQLARGLVKIGEKWVAGEEAALLRKGFRKFKGQWMSREDLDAARSNWEDAWAEETAHYRIRTNESEGFAKDLGLLVEAAYGEFRTFYGDEPKLPAKEKMELFAFRSYEDYRRYCVEHKAEAQLNAAGFAASGSNTVVGWNKTRNGQQFLQTMVHEAAHLFWYRVAPAAQAPSWFAEGMATYFEGYAWDGKAYKLTFVSESRLPFAREAMKGGRHIPIAELVGADALALINRDPTKALLFYAECWALNYFLCRTQNKAWKDAYAEYRKSVARGNADPLSKFFPDLGKLEAEWVEFVKGM